MDGFQILLLAAAVVGVILAAASFFIQSKTGSAEDKFDGADNVLKAVGASVEEADNAAEELHKLAGSVMEEMEGKYQELLFLYNLIDEKKKEISAGGWNSGAKREPAKKKPLKHPKQQEILRMVGEGMAVADIAKELGMGQGEVNLILELGGR